MSDATFNTEPAEHQVPKAVSEVSPAQPEVRGRATGQSQFTVPDSNGMSAVTVKEKEEKTEDLAGHKVEEEEEEEKMKIQQDSPHLSVIKRETMKRDRKWDLVSIERQRALVEASLMLSRSEVRELDKTIEAKEREVKVFEHIIERENHTFQEFLKCIKKKSVDAKTLFEKESKAIQEKNAAIEKLADQIETIKSELAKNEEILNKYKRYENILFKLSPPEWQEAQEAESLKAQVPSDRGAQDEQNREPQDSAIRQGLERGSESTPGRVLPSTKEPTLSSAHSDTLITDSKLDCDNSEHEDKLELYFSDPQQLLDLVTELTEQNLSLIQNSTRVDETLEELRQTTETTLKKMKEDEEKLTLQVNDMRDRISKEKERAADLKKKVQLHDSLKTEDQDVLLNALDMKVTEVYRCCVDRRLTNLSTLEKLSCVEYRMSSLLEVIESIPKESLETLRQIKDSERRSRLREEELRLEREKQKERMQKCMQRSLGDAKKISGRKLMFRCIPVKQKTKVSDEDTIPAEDELHAYLFTTEDVE